MDERRAATVARALGGHAWNSGGDIWLALIPKADGRIVAISDEVICEYSNEDSLMSGQSEASIFLAAEMHAI